MSRISNFLALAAGGMLAGASAASAGLLVYEPFNYGDSGFNFSTTASSNPTPNASTVGLDTTVNWTKTNSSTWSYNPAGLAMGTGTVTLSTTGGRLNGDGSNPAPSVAARLDQTGSTTGTLWSSMLGKKTGQWNGGTSGGPQARIQEAASDTHSIDQVRFGMNVETYHNKSATTEKRPAVAYGNDGAKSNGGGEANADAQIALDTTYLFIARYTHVGDALSVGTPGVATMWVLTEAQFDAFKTLGGITEAELDAATTGTLATQVTAKAVRSQTSGTFTFGDDDFLAIGAFGTSADGQVDEIRYGTEIGNVVPLIPEPASTAGIVLAGAGLLARRRRH